MDIVAAPLMVGNQGNQAIWWLDINTPAIAGKGVSATHRLLLGMSYVVLIWPNHKKLQNEYLIYGIPAPAVCYVRFKPFSMHATRYMVLGDFGRGHFNPLHMLTMTP